MTQARSKSVPRGSHFRFWFWLAGALLFFAFLWLIRGILLPFVVGMLTAYFLDPAVRYLRSQGVPRGRSATLITVGFFLLAVSVCAIIMPPLAHQLGSLLAKLPDFLDHIQTVYSDELDYYLSLLTPDQLKIVKGSLGNFSTTLMTGAGNVAGGVWRSGLALLNLLSLVFLTPIVAFYLLRDWHVVISHFYTLLPRNQAATIREQLREVDNALAGFIRGQTNICLIMACYYSILLPLVGLNFGLLLGIASGLLLFIPFIGFMSCFVVSVIVALLQFTDSTHILLVLAIYGVGQAIESGFLTPRLVGGKVGLHPLWIIFGMLVGATLLGFVGVLIAVPLTAVIGVLVRFAISHYLRSSLYTGETT